MEIPKTFVVHHADIMLHHICVFAALFLPSVDLLIVPQPINPLITSTEFKHILTWEPGPGSPTGVCYHVQVYKLRLNRNLSVPGCECVRFPPSCNLTLTLTDLWDSYYPQIWAVLGSQSSSVVQTEAFIPVDHTHPGPPVVSVRSQDSNICVSLKSPSQRLLPLYNLSRYKVAISDGVGRRWFHMDVKGLKEVEFSDLLPGRPYCVNVTMKHPKAISSDTQCVYLPTHLNTDSLITSTVCVISVLMILAAALLTYSGKIFLKKSLPHVLTSVCAQVFEPFPLDDSCVLSWVSVSDPKLFITHTLVYEAGPGDPEHSDCDIRYKRWRSPILSQENSSDSAESQSDCLSASHTRHTHPTAQPEESTDMHTQQHDVCAHQPDVPLNTEWECVGDIDLLTVSLGQQKEEDDDDDEEENVDMSSLVFPDIIHPPITADTHILKEHSSEEEEEEVVPCSGYMQR